MSCINDYSSGQSSLIMQISLRPFYNIAASAIAWIIQKPVPAHFPDPFRPAPGGIVQPVGNRILHIAAFVAAARFKRWQTMPGFGLQRSNVFRPDPA